MMVDSTAQGTPDRPRPVAEIGIVAQDFKRDEFRARRRLRELAGHPRLALIVKPHFKRAASQQRCCPRSGGPEVDVGRAH